MALNLTDLEQTALAYWLVKEADSVNIAGRFFPRADFINSFEDKLRIRLRKFGPKVSGKMKPVAEQLVDRMIEQGSLSTQPGKLGGVMHQFQAPEWKTLVAELKAENPIVAKGADADDAFWEEAFAGLVA